MQPPLKPRILLAEDEIDLAAFVSDGLREADFEVDHFADGEKALAQAHSVSYSALILDIMLPGMDGLEVLRRLRKTGNAVPVIIITAKGAADERVEGLELGADDYMVKPFYMAELIARLRSVLRRSEGQSHSVLTVKDLSIDMMSREATRAGQKIDLTAREFQLLAYMMEAEGRVLTRTQILENVWDYHFDPGSNIIESTIRRLRSKIDQGFGEPLIETLRGVGYRLGGDASKGAK